MKIQELFDIDHFIKTNDIKEVTSQQIYKSQGAFNPTGLFSEDIFGQTNEERSYKCGYIKLPVHIFNPAIAKTIISRSGGIIRKMAYGEIKCNLIDGTLVEDKEGEFSGFKDLYNIWDQIDINKTLKTRSDVNINILTKSPKRLLFNDKVIVLPPNFRPIGMRNGRQVKNELNSLYMAIIGLKSVTAHTTSNPNQVYCKFQNATMNIFTYIHDHVGTKNGFFQKNLLAKSTMFTARNVISAPSYNANRRPPVGVFKTGYPLHTCVSMFKPFVLYEMRNFLSYSNIQQMHTDPSEIDSTMLEYIYDNKFIEDLCEIYMNNPGSRFRIMYLDEENTLPIKIEYMDLNKNEKVIRPLTLTDVIYQCCKRAIVDKDKMIYLVRYPIGDCYGSFFTRCHILSTNKTTRIEFLGETFDYYPIIDLSLSHNRISTSFAETLTPSNSRLKAICGDYDGDTVKSTGIWSDEANEQAKKIMLSKIYNIKSDANSIYDIGIECLNGLYALTKVNET